MRPAWPFPSRRAWRSAALAALVVACGDEVAGPIPGVVTGVTLDPVAHTLVSLNQTVQITANVQDGTGAPVTATLTWSSDDPTVASVSDAGLVTAVKNGVTTIRARVNDVKAGAIITVAQVAASLEATRGDSQGGTVGFPLDSSIVVSARDALGSLVAASATVQFTTPHGGTLTPAIALVDGAGRATTQWTLGAGAGVQELLAAVSTAANVSVTFSASAFADEPDSMYLYAGAGQLERPSLPLPAPIQVRVIDRHGNGVPDVPITFSLLGEGALDLTEALTDLDGVAGVAWTLGPDLGDQQVQALLPDSVVGAIVDLPGSPVTFSATAVVFEVTGVEPATPVVGQEMTISGTGFDVSPQNNGVTVDGVAATVLTATSTSLTVAVPSFGCTPELSRQVRVSRATLMDSLITVIRPANALALGVGETAVVTSPADYCLQFLPAASGADEYLVGLTATRALGGTASFVMAGDDGATVPPAPIMGGRPAAAAPSTGSQPDRERALRDWESAFFAGSSRPASAFAPRAAGAPAAPPAVGDVIGFRVPDLSTDPCNAFTAVDATVLAVGSRAIVATDATLPSDPQSQMDIANALNQFMNTFGDLIYGVAATYFGEPGDLDQNGRIILLFSNAVAALSVPGFTSAVDLLDRTTCPASDQGEMVYAAIPPAPAAADLAALLQSSGPVLAHDLTHLIQLSRRLSVDGIPMAAWLAEAQAELGTEIVGMATRGDVARMDYGAAVVNGSAEGTLWYRPRFDRLSYLFGWDGAAGTLAGAPERCSLFGFGGLTVPCAPPYAAGAAWSFLRYVSDRFGAAYATGEAGFLRDLIGQSPDRDGTGVLATLAGGDLSRLIVDWAMTLYVDGRVAAGAAPTLELGSWNLADVFESLAAAQRLSPETFDFASFASAGSVVGGGTAYARIATSAAHGPLALRVRDPAGNALGDDLNPRLWVVRVR